ncbi:hypothetical protein GQ53DRAFT_745475 [Thozetella sp. PMI_491]|nr:hypothetical protein GQ53DRAFT_745475 [Thozetella sp. PMI_491]
MLLIAAGGSIGAGLFVGSGQGLSIGGPGSLVLTFAIIGTMVSFTMSALGEMATAYPVAGAFYDYAVRFVSPHWGFAMGWNFILNWLIVLPFELTTIVAQVAYWGNVHPAAIIVPFTAVLAVSSIFGGAKVFGELEHWLGLCKSVAILAFLCFSLGATFGGIPGDPRGALGDRYWKDPGAFRNGFQGFLAVFRIAGGAYGGTELLGMTVAECRRPHRIMPLATKVVFFRLIVFYIGSLLMLGFMVPANSDKLASVGHGARESPFVLAANLTGASWLGHFFNAMIVTALVSMANTSSFASSRALQALCTKGMGVRFFAEVRNGIPLNALVLAYVVALLSLVTIAPKGEQLFDWLLSISSMSNYFTWATICYSHIRMHRAIKVQKCDAGELIWRSPLGTWGSWAGIVVCFFGLAAQIIGAAWPIGNVYNTTNVIRDVIGVAFMIGLFGAYVAYRKWFYGDKQVMVPLEEIDLATGYRNKAYARMLDDEVVAESP